MPYYSGTYANNEEQIYQILKANGYNVAQICGILANIEEESKYNPAAYNSREGAYGLCQWRESRKNNLFSRYTSSPSVYNQIKFISDEFNSSEKTARDDFRKATNTEQGAYDAGLSFASKYERCATSQRVPRANKAKEYWRYYNGHTPSAQPSEDLKFNDDTPGTGGSTSPASRGSVSSTGDAVPLINSLNKVAAEGYDYGYLIDVTYGGEFKFYIPEFQEAAGTNWEDISIPGRSVSIKSYSNTTSRNVTVSLDLYAGVGLYSGDSSSDVVGAMHDDLNFVKSLEYPDYSSTIARPPATVHLILGAAFSLEGVVSGVTVEHMKPLDSQNRAMYAKLSFTVTQNVSDPPGWSEIRGGSVAIATSADRNPSRMSDRPAIDYSSGIYKGTK